MMNLAYFYVIIEKETGRCSQTLEIDDGNVHIDDDYAYSMMVDIRTVEYVDKYYIGGSWFEKVWNEYDEDGVPVESAGYILNPWTPEG